MSAADLDNTLYLDVPAGRVVIELRPDLAPQTVAHIKELAKKGFYDGLKFHRVIPGFMAQTGDPTGTGMGGSKKPNLKAAPQCDLLLMKDSCPTSGLMCASLDGTN